MDGIDHIAISLRQSHKTRSISIVDEAENSSDAVKNLLLKSAPFYKFVLTGGPCGGYVLIKKGITKRKCRTVCEVQ
jgi:hypothetical protein